MKFNYRVFQLGEDAIVIEMGQDFTKETHLMLNLLRKEIINQVLPHNCETAITFTTLTVYFDKTLLENTNPIEYFSRIIDNFLIQYKNHQVETKQTIEIPVCYHKQLAPDLEQVAAMNGLTIEELIHIHTKETYFVSYFDFGQDIPFIGGVNKNLSVPRKKGIQVNIPYGVVGITGSQTGIYPINSTVGWQIIGRAPSRVLNQLRLSMEPGSDVRFYPITLEQFYEFELQHIQSDIS